MMDDNRKSCSIESDVRIDFCVLSVFSDGLTVLFVLCVGIGDLGIACELPTWVYDAVMPWWSVWKPCSF